MSRDEPPEGATPVASTIRLERVSKRFPGQPCPAVDDVSLTFERGQLVVLLGPSGCGKTTLLKLINRLYEPTSGRIYLDDQPTDALPAPQLRRRIGYVIQQTGLFPHMRVEDNVAVVPRLLGWEPRRIERRVDELLDLIGLPPAQFRRRYPAQLSGGEQQRVGLARALAANPTTLLMDEPFGALDAITRTHLQDELLRIHRRTGQTIIFVTHDIDEAVKLADRVVVMDEGQVVQHDEPARVVLQPANAFVSDLMGSSDVLRRLSLIPVGAVVKPLGSRELPGEPTVTETTDLRAALAQLIASEASRLTVVDAEGQPLGTIDLQTIRHAGQLAAATIGSGAAGRTTT